MQVAMTDAQNLLSLMQHSLDAVTTHRRQIVRELSWEDPDERRYRLGSESR
jgi:hypothetical protein